MDEEVVLLEEQLATAHADIERLQTQMAELAALDSRRDGELQTLRSQLEASRTEGDAARSELAAQADETLQLRESIEQAAAQSREALGRYREAVLQREPQLPAELVTGDTVSELESAVERARQTVAQVRQHLEQQAQALRVPAGAPARGSPDTSDLTAGEKIRLGLQKG
jgi:regulator of replication initiation timing